jgi:hypothetical protein
MALTLKRRSARILLGLVLGAAVVAGAFAWRGVLRARVLSLLGVCGPLIPGPASSLANEHLSELRLDASPEPDTVVQHPTLGLELSRSTLLMGFSKRATVEEVNDALCESRARIVQVMSAIQTLVLQFPQAESVADLNDARGVLQTHRVVDHAAFNFILRNDGSRTETQGGDSEKEKQPLRQWCDWASLQVMKKYDIQDPIWCGSERAEVNGRELFFVFLRPDKESELTAIVDDDGVFPLGSAFVDGRPKPGPELTGLRHWSQRTALGQHYAKLAMTRKTLIEGPMSHLYERYQETIAQFQEQCQRCFAQDGSAKGKYLKLEWLVHPDGSVSDGKVSAHSSSPGPEVERCVLAMLANTRFPGHELEDIFPYTGVCEPPFIFP